MKPRYRVTLTAQERAELDTLTKSAKTNARKFVYARALLLCDTGPYGTVWSVGKISEAMGVTTRTLEHLKKRFVEEGLSAALEHKHREKPPRDATFNGAFEARLIKLACSKTPEGRKRWTVRLLAEKAVELNITPSVSHMTVHRLLKKMNLSLTSKSTGRSHRRRTVRS
jgi:transposase